ncbi:MAG: SIS domain-containing protein [Oscillospiraceae bacterium]|nr:SIS domain-containing protein [Oscillospiraceae bacterium]
MEVRDNYVKKGFLSYPGYSREIVDILTDGRIKNAIPEERLRDIERVIITGNGDSYAASLATREFNSRMFRNKDYYALRCIDVARHFVFPTERPEKTLVLVISVSGGGSRVTEAMARARKKGCTSLAITGNPDSRMAKEAEFVLKIEQPKSNEPFTISMQTRNYFTALLTTTFFGAYAGLLFGNITGEEIDELKEEVVKYVEAVCSAEILSLIDDKTEQMANSWKDYLGFDLCGGGSDFATAYFGAAKFFELCGSLNCLNDSEDWCHIDYFQTKRDQLGTIAVAMKNCASFSRTMETVASMVKSGRNVLVISDASQEEFYAGAEVITLPSAKHECLNPLMNFIPLFMLANYIAIKRNYPYFGGMGDENPLFSQEGGINTIKSSEIVYVE